jgi:uncharacterized membrane protein YoaK (UPF0700 family)
MTVRVGPHGSVVRARNAAAMALAAASGSTDAIGYLALGHVFTSAMTGNLTLLGIAVVGAALGARIARSPEPGHPVWPSAVTRALALEAVFFVVYAVSWWALGPRPDVYGNAALLGLGATALGIQSSAMQRFGSGVGLNTTFLSGSLVRLVGRLATGHRYRDIHHHLLVLVGLVCGGCLGALLVLHARALAPLVALAGLAFALGAACWQARTRPRAAEETTERHPDAVSAT